MIVGFKNDFYSYFMRNRIIGLGAAAATKAVNIFSQHAMDNSFISLYIMDVPVSAYAVSFGTATIIVLESAVARNCVL